MCMASVSDCRALAAAQPVDVTSARMPWFISSQADRRRREGGEREKEKKGLSSMNVFDCHKVCKLRFIRFQRLDRLMPMWSYFNERHLGATSTVSVTKK